ncbi:MAG: hypothetical protein EBX99_03075 [Acidimicrobiia bacterium]|nr:hypothetical protein [Acidimicrobiia bacterium]
MARRKPPFENGRNGYIINLDDDERHFIRRLVGEVRELLTSMPVGDPKMARLFPPAYTHSTGEDADAETEYQRLMRDELVASRLDSIGRTTSCPGSWTVRSPRSCRADGSGGIGRAGC